MYYNEIDSDILTDVLDSGGFADKDDSSHSIQAFKVKVCNVWFDKLCLNIDLSNANKAYD